MDRISELPEHLLLKILSFLPTTKDVVATMVLSKRWEFLWMLVPRLVYDDSYENIKEESFSRFVDRSLLLHEAPVLEYVRFKLGGKSSDVDDIGVWARNVARRRVRELVIEIDRSSCSTAPAMIPKSLYTVSGMLATLKLDNVILAGVVSSPVCFSSLKILSLASIKYPGGDKSVNMLLSSCPVLESLKVLRIHDDNVTIFTVRVPSLKVLRMFNFTGQHGDDANGVVIDAPCLDNLIILDRTDGFCVLENKMPNVVTVDIDLTFSPSWKILGSISQVEALRLCVSSSSQDAYPSGCVFHRLVDFTLHRFKRQLLDLLMCVLRDSPKLRTLNLVQCHGSQADQPSSCWSEPSLVPECLISSLETLEWKNYEGTKEENDFSKKKTKEENGVVEYILRNGRFLKRVTISSKPTDSNKKLDMIKKLTSSFRRSPICQLVFD